MYVGALLVERTEKAGAFNGDEKHRGADIVSSGQCFEGWARKRSYVPPQPLRRDEKGSGEDVGLSFCNAGLLSIVLEHPVAKFMRDGEAMAHPGLTLGEFKTQ